MPYIYKITNPKNAIYVGSTKNTTKQRWREYKNLVCKGQPKLHNSLVKYGVINHKFEIICECSLEDMLKLENYYGRLYNVLDNKIGLNCKIPKSDDNYLSISQETKDKISKSHLELNAKRGPRNKEYRDKMSLVTTGEKNGNYGKKHTEEFKNYQSEKQSIPIFQYDLEGNFIQEWKSIVFASKTLNIHEGMISSCCKGKWYRTCGGYRWKYKSDVPFDKIGKNYYEMPIIYFKRKDWLEQFTHTSYL